MGTKPKVIDINFKDRTHNTPGEAASPRYNKNGGGGDMNDKDFVTHTELELSNEKLLRHMDEHFNQLEKKIDANKADTDLKFESINTKFEKQQVWITKELAATAIFIVTILGFLITILTFVK